MRRSGYQPVFYDQNGRPICFLSGARTADVCQVFKPSPSQCRQMLIELQAKLGLSSGTMAATLGVPRITLGRWVNAQRNPSGAARRLIWLLHKMHFSPLSLWMLGSWMHWNNSGPAPGEVYGSIEEALRAGLGDDDEDAESQSAERVAADTQPSD